MFSQDLLKWNSQQDENKEIKPATICLLSQHWNVALGGGECPLNST